MVKALLVIAMMAGCHFGAGPAVAYSPQSGLRAGFDASAGFGFVRGSVGGTWAPLSDGPSRSYITFDPGYAHKVGRVLRNEVDSYEIYLGGGATIGKAYGHDGNGRAAGVWATGTMFDYSCDDTNVVYTIAIGYRVLAGIGELFITPKANVYAEPLRCWH